MIRTACFKILGLAACALLLAGMAAAQIPDDVYFVSYYSGANATDGTDGKVRIDNPGVDNGSNLCADIYVFDANQEQIECCGCTLTPDDLRTISVNGNLLHNTAN